MNIKTIMVAAAVCGCISLAKAADEVAKAEKGETEEKEDTLVSAEGYLGVDSRYMTYGLIDGKDPIARLNAYVTFFDWWYIGGEVLTDLTKGNGKRGGYGNRAGKLMTLDAQTGLAHEFNLGKTLGRLNIDFYFTYEYLPRHHGSMNDTDYLDVEFKLPDLWFEPRLWIERDLMLDEGTYVNLEVGHTFPLIGEGENATLTIKPSVAQGFGNTQRVRGYLYRDRGGEEPLDHGGLMDSTIKGVLRQPEACRIRGVQRLLARPRDAPRRPQPQCVLGTWQQVRHLLELLRRRRRQVLILMCSGPIGSAMSHLTIPAFRRGSFFVHSVPRGVPVPVTQSPNTRSVPRTRNGRSSPSARYSRTAMKSGSISSSNV